MRVLVIVKANEQSEAGVMPDEKILAAMGAYNEELVKAGAMLAGEGLHPSRKGKRIAFDGSRKTVVDGPFAETKELIAGFWIWQVRSMDEAVEWLKRAPFQEGVVELRPIFEAEDFGKEFTPELRAQEERLRAEMAAQAEELGFPVVLKSMDPTLLRRRPGALSVAIARTRDDAMALYDAMATARNPYGDGHAAEVTQSPQLGDCAVGDPRV